MNRWIPLLIALVSLSVLGCGSGNRPYAPSGVNGVVATPTPKPGGGAVDTFPDFNITPPTATFPSPALKPDGTMEVSLTVRTNTSVGAPIALSLQNPPTGVTATFSPASVAPSSGPVAVAMTLRVADFSKSGTVTVLGKSGTIERLTSVNYSAYVAPSGFAIAVAPVVGQSNGGRTRLFDVTLSQTAGSGEVFLDVDRSDTSGGTTIVPLALPIGTTVTGLPNSVTLAAGEAGRTFRLSVTLPEGSINFFYGFGVTAERGGRKERAATEFSYTGASAFDVSSEVTASGNTDTVALTYTPLNATFSGTLVVDRAADGTLVDGSGTALATLPAGTVVTGLPQTLTFDGTGKPRTATFTVTAPAGTSTTTFYGIRVRATSPGSDATTESVLLLQFRSGGG